MKHALLTIIAISGVLLMLTGVGWASPAAALKRSVELYQENDLIGARDTLTNALVDAPDHPALHYDLGSILYKQGEYEQAQKEFNAALETLDKSDLPKAFKDELKQRSLYNLGNSVFRGSMFSKDQKQLERALDYYSQTLKENDKLNDARYNYELVKKRLDELKQQQQQQEKQDQQKQDQQQQQQKQDQQKQDQQKQDQQQDQQKQDQQKQDQQKQEQQQKNEQQQQQQPQQQKGEVDKDIAEQLLKSAQQDEAKHEDVMKQLLAPQTQPERVDKDW